MHRSEKQKKLACDMRRAAALLCARAAAVRPARRPAAVTTSTQLAMRPKGSVKSSAASANQAPHTAWCTHRQVSKAQSSYC
eukprot:4437107-Prymnesium_polylepis.1